MYRMMSTGRISNGNTPFAPPSVVETAGWSSNTIRTGQSERRSHVSLASVMPLSVKK